MTSKILHLPATLSGELIIEGEKKVWKPVKEKKEQGISFLQPSQGSCCHLYKGKPDQWEESKINLFMQKYYMIWDPSEMKSEHPGKLILQTLMQKCDSRTQNVVWGPSTGGFSRPVSTLGVE